VNSVHFAARYVVLNLSYYSLKEVEGGKMGEEYTAANQSKLRKKSSPRKIGVGKNGGRRPTVLERKMVEIWSTVLNLRFLRFWLQVLLYVEVVAVYVNKSLVSAHFVLWFIIIQTSFSALSSSRWCESSVFHLIS